jgi:hypothetical protein
MEKRCRICNLVKPINEFPPTYAMCIDCRNSKRRKERNEKNQQPEEYLLPHTPKYNQILATYDGKKVTIDNVIDSLQQLLKEAYIIKESSLQLSFPYELTPVVFNFLKFCVKEQKVRLRNVKAIVSNKAIEKEFVNIYGIEQAIMSKHLETITNVADTVGGIFMHYNTFIDDMNYAMSKTPGWKKIELLGEHEVEYNFTISCIEIKHNPLRLDAHQFFKMIKADRGDISRIAFHELGVFDNYYVLYNVQ